MSEEQSSDETAVEIQEFLESEYGISDVVVEKYPFCNANKCYSAKSSGSNTPVLFIKVHNSNKSLETIVIEEEAFEKLDEKGVGIPQVRKTKDSEKHSSFKGHYFSVYDFVQGKEYVDSNFDMLDSAAIFHRFFLDSVQSVDVPEGYESPVMGFKSPGFEEWSEKLMTLLDHSDPEVAGRAQKLLKYGEKLKQAFNIEAYLSLPKMVINGDYQPFNLLFSGNDSVSHVFDLEFMERNTIAYELARSLIIFARSKRQIDPAAVEYRTVRYLQQFLQGDSEIVRQAASQIEWIPVLMFEKSYQFAINDLYMMVNKLGGGGIKSCDRNLALLDWFENNPDYLKDFARHKNFEVFRASNRTPGKGTYCGAFNGADIWYSHRFHAGVRPEEELHAHDVPEYYRALDGSATLEIEGSLVELCKGDLYLVHPGIKHRMHSVGQDGVDLETFRVSHSIKS